MLVRSLPLRVLAISFIVLALPLLVDSFIFFQHAYEDSIHDAKESIKETANFRAYAISEFEPVQQLWLRELVVLLDLEHTISSLPNKEFGDELSKLSLINPSLEAYILSTGEKGEYKILAANHLQFVNKNFKYPFLLERALGQNKEGDFLIFHRNHLSGEEEPYIFKVRLIELDEKPQGILVLGSSLQEKVAPLMQAFKESEMTINFGILTRDGIVFLATDPSLLGQFFRPLTADQRLVILQSKQLGQLSLAQQALSTIYEEGNSFFEFSLNNEMQIAYQVHIPKVDLSFMTYTTKADLFNRSIKHFLLIYTVYGLIFIVGGGISYWLTNWISRPLMQLCKLMEKVGEGHLDVRFKEEPLGYEINLLGNIFNHTLDSLFENIQRAEHERILKETFRKELELGQEVQRNLLPKEIHQLAGIELDGAYLSSKEVGGDFYDIFLKSKNTVVLSIADAAGKGISACLYALAVRSMLRTYVTLYDDVGVILSQTNNMFLKDTGDSGMFVTAVMGIYDSATRIFTYYSCGHVPGIVRRADGHLVTLSHSGMALGLKEALTPYKGDSIQLFPGDILLLYTDGLLDVENKNFQHFSERRLRTLLQRTRWNTAKEVVQGLKEELKDFSEGIPSEEEIAILCMKVH